MGGVPEVIGSCSFLSRGGSLLRLRLVGAFDLGISVTHVVYALEFMPFTNPNI